MVDRKSIDVEGDDPPVKKIRELLGLSQQQFATLLGIAISTVSRWENRKGTPMFTPGQFKILLRALEPHGVTLEDLPDDLKGTAKS